MRFWSFVEMDTNTAGEIYAKSVTMSDQEILDYYWEWWSNKMKEVIVSGRKTSISHEDITEENCIDDFCIVHWASRNYWREIKEYYE